MSGIQLLDKTRKIGKLLHNSHSSKVVFNDICKVMQDAQQSNVLVISRKGKVLGISGMDGGAIRELSGCNGAGNGPVDVLRQCETVFRKRGPAHRSAPGGGLSGKSRG